jgi:hypothetical protein
MLHPKPKVYLLLPLATEIRQSLKYVLIYQQVGLWLVSSRYGCQKVAKANNFLSLTFWIILTDLIIVMDEKFIYYINDMATVTYTITFIMLIM